MNMNQQSAPMADMSDIPLAELPSVDEKKYCTVLMFCKTIGAL